MADTFFLTGKPLPIWMCACVHVCVCVRVKKCVRQTDRLAAANIALFQFTVHHVLCACRTHNERNRTGKVQIVTAATYFGYVNWPSSGC